MPFKPIPDELEVIAKEIVDSAYVVHHELGPGLLEQVYEICLCQRVLKIYQKTSNFDYPQIN